MYFDEYENAVQFIVMQEIVDYLSKRPEKFELSNDQIMVEMMNDFMLDTNNPMTLEELEDIKKWAELVTAV